MTVSYFIQCPVCNTVTRMRSSAGYIHRTPVRIHCGKCNTLLTGHFISDDANAKAYFEPGNCTEVSARPYDYYGEASGELLCRKITYLPDEGLTIPTTLSPAMSFLMSIETEERDHFIDFACHLASMREAWDKERIFYDLVINKKSDVLKRNYAHIAEINGYSLESEVGVLCYYYYSYFTNIGGVFTKKNLISNLRTVNYEINHLDRTALFDFIAFLQTGNRLQHAQARMYEIMESFIGISSFVIPAIGAMRYREPDSINKEEIGISTCSFEDIKSFYQNTYEVLGEYCDIVIGLNNAKYRESYESFAFNLTMEKFVDQTKGNRIKSLSQEECFSSLFAIKDNSNELRNAIGHSDVKYNGTDQTIEYVPNHRKPSDSRSAFLLDVAIQCVELMQSSVILSMIIYKLSFLLKCADTTSVQMHPMFYSGTHGSSRCPCGSGLPFRKCCKPIVSKYAKGFKMPTIMNYSNTVFDAGQID